VDAGAGHFGASCARPQLFSGAARPRSLTRPRSTPALLCSALLCSPLLRPGLRSCCVCPPTATARAPAAMDGHDPVIAEYHVFITPEMEQQLYVLQYLNRRPNQPFVKSEGAVPSEVRVKEQSGFIEVDVALPIKSNFNRQAGVRWGEAMRKTKQFGQKAYGIASGFERAMPRAARPGAPADGAAQPALDDNADEDDYVANFEDANEKGHVLNTQTYGGQLVKEDGKGPTYMLGTFKKSA
jgi:DNA-directed RNA polymerase-3 subunit RPC5